MPKLDKTINWSNKIKVSPEEIEKCKIYATDVLTKMEFRGDISVKVGKILSVCLEGWERAPDSFLERVKMKLGRKRVSYYEKGNFGKLPDELGKNNNRLIPKKEEIGKKLQKETLSQIEQADTLELISPAFLSSEELKYVDDRKSTYNKEFEFNESSDQVLLQQILIDELIIRRINLARLQGSDDISQSDIDKIMDRFRKNLEKLGVLRVQRLELNSDIQGNVGQLSMELEKKLERIKKLKDKQLREEIIDKLRDKLAYSTKRELLEIIEEIELQRLHDLEQPDNEIPYDLDEEDE